jgi:protein-tyrosine-phosphatase
MNVLFVCAGNTCRSPLAAALAARELGRIGLTATATSAGVQAVDDAPASGIDQVVPKSASTCGCTRPGC